MQRDFRYRTIGILSIASIVAASAITVSGQYSLTVNKERLENARNEPQNWLLMNGDYGANRYSRLTQINRDNVGSLRMVWALFVEAHRVSRVVLDSV